jgi:hypothetical protein
LAAAGSNSSTGGWNNHVNTVTPASSTAKWMIKPHRHRTTHGSQTLGPGNTAARRPAGGSVSAAAAAADSSWMDPHVGFDLMQNLGLAGGFAGRMALLGAILLHGVLLAVRSRHSIVCFRHLQAFAQKRFSCC